VSARAGALLALALALGPPARTAEPTVNWPSFRGNAASGVAHGSALPASWDVPAGVGVRWVRPVPGLGHASPVIWGDRVFVATAVSAKHDPELVVGLYGDIAPVEDASTHSFRLLCFDKRTGELLWSRTAHEGVPKIKRHTKATHANSTPATDGKHVAVSFGSEGLHVYDFEGKLLWKKDLGLLDAGYYLVPDAQWGFGSSPVIHDGRVIVQCDVQGQDFLAAFDVRDGREVWRAARDEVPTWSTPAIVERAGGKQVVVNGYKQIGGYEFATGKQVWQMRGGGDIPVPTPIVAHDLVFLTNAHGGPAPIWAVRTSAAGDVTLAEGAASNEHVAWSTPAGGAYMQTPLVFDDLLYVCRDNGVLSVFEATTGKAVYTERLGSGSSGFTASAVAGDGKIYYTSELGDVHVVRAGRKFERLAVNPLGEIAMATPAISEGTLYFRTKNALVAVGGVAAKPTAAAD
jgi:outer membrane protein assembly factor BamB